MSYKSIYIEEVLYKISERPYKMLREENISLSYRDILATAVYHNLPDAVGQLLDCMEFDKEFLQDIGLGEARTPYPIYL